MQKTEEIILPSSSDEPAGVGGGVSELKGKKIKLKWLKTQTKRGEITHTKTV